MKRIAYFHRLSFEKSEERFKVEAKKLDINLVFIKYERLKLVDDKIFFGNEDLIDFDGWYFRAVGKELEWAKLLQLYARKHHIPIVDEYLLTEGPLRRAKAIMGFQLKEAGVNYPQTSLVESWGDLEKEVGLKKLPLIVKLSSGGRHGMGTFWLKSQEDLKTLAEKLKKRVKRAKEIGKENPEYRQFLIQEYIPNDGDFRVMTIGYKCIGGFKRKPKQEKLVMNKSLGKSTGLDEVPPEVAIEAEKAAKALEVEIAGTDLVRDKRDGKIYIVEVNEAPQFKIFEKRTNVNAAKKILEYVKQKCQLEKSSS